MKSTRLISTVVKNQFWVSTIRRLSSTVPEMWYYETIVFVKPENNPESKEWHIQDMKSCGDSDFLAYETHASAVGEVITEMAEG